MYNVVILAEQAMTAADAQEVVSLHEAIEDTRHYHVVIPCEDATRQAEFGYGSIGPYDAIAAPPVAAALIDIDAAQEAIDKQASNAVQATITRLRALGMQASGEFSSKDPLDTLARAVADSHADEVIVMTLPHAISELFHLDWTSKARRRLGVPILHLLEHEPLDAEAGDGQGITGM
jgi:hypothetical protein